MSSVRDYIPKRRDWQKGRTQVGAFVRTKTGTTLQSVTDNATPEHTEQALDMVCGSFEWKAMQEVARAAAAARGRAPYDLPTDLADALDELAKLRASRSEP